MSCPLRAVLARHPTEMLGSCPWASFKHFVRRNGQVVVVVRFDPMNATFAITTLLEENDRARGPHECRVARAASNCAVGATIPTNPRRAICQI